MNVKFDFIKNYREQHEGMSLRDAHAYINSVLNSPKLDPELFVDYCDALDKRTSEVIECVFQNSPLQYSYCETIVKALIHKGYVTI